MEAGRIPADDAPELDWLVYEQSGVLTHRQAATCLTPARVRGHIRCGRWRSIARGLLLAGNGALTRPQQLWVAVLAASAPMGHGPARPDAVLAGETAAAEDGVRRLASEPIHVLIRADRHRTRRILRLPADMPAVVVHRTTVLPREHLQRARPPRTRLARSVIDGAGWAPTDDAARMVIVSACQQRRVTPTELSAVVDMLPRVRRHSLIVETISDAAGGAGTLSEIDLVRLCRRYRLPEPDLQERRRDASGRLRFLDAYWREWSLHVEIDGAHHMNAENWEADMRRQNEVWISGDRILRFSSYQTRRHAAYVADQIERALRAAGWHPGHQPRRQHGDLG